MEVEAVRSFFGWCTLVNWAFLLWWGSFFAFAADWVYGMHRKLFKISRTTFDATNYAGMGLFKIFVLVFNLVPYLVLRIFF